MNNIVGTYLMFKANNIVNYIEILAEEQRKLSKIPKSLNKLIYKYYDLFILSEKELDYDKLKEITGLDLGHEQLLLFYLLIEFDMASKTEYQDSLLYDFYDFIVNSIIIFSNLENMKVTNKQLVYDEIIKKIIKKNSKLINDEYKTLLENTHNSLCKVFNTSYKKELKFYEMYRSSTYSVKYSKIKNSFEYYLAKFNYNNPAFNNESRKDLQLVKKEFNLQVNLIGLEITLMRVLRDTLSGIKRTIFVILDDDVIAKKTNLDIFVNMNKLRFLKERMIFLVQTSLLEKYEERLKELITDGFEISYLKNDKLTSYDIFKNNGYIIMDYNEYSSNFEFCKKHNLEVIINKVDKKDIENLAGIKYIGT